MIVRAYLNSLLSLVKSGLIYCAAARHVDGAKKWDGKQAVDTPSSNNTSLCLSPATSLVGRRFSSSMTPEVECGAPPPNPGQSASDNS